MLYPDHAKLNPFPVGIHVHHSDHDMLVDGHDFRRIGDVSFGQLGEVYKPVLLDAYIDESSEMVILPTMPGRIMPSRKSAMVRTFLSVQIP